jgi:hypothetical protein
MTNDWYTADKLHVLKALKMATWRNADAKLEAADVQAMDQIISARLFEPSAIAMPLGDTSSYLPKFRTSSYVPGIYQEVAYLQTAFNLYPSMGVCSTTEATPNIHAITLRTTQTPTNQGRHLERENTTDAESERIDILGMMCDTHHLECSEANPVAFQSLSWSTSFTKNSATDDIASSIVTDEPFKWSHITFPTFTYNSETIEADILGWSLDIRNTVRVTSLDSNGYYTIGRYIPLTYISVTLQIQPYGHNPFELIRTKLESYATDLDLTVKLARNATTDYIQFTHDKLYCRPVDIYQIKQPGSVESYYIQMHQMNTGSLAIEAKDAYNNNYYENP